MPDVPARPASGRRGGLAVMLAAVLWGTTGTAQAVSGYAGSPLGLGVARIAGAGLILLMVAGGVHGPPVWRRVWRAGTRRAVTLGAACVAAYQVCFFVATRSTGVAVGTLTAIGSAPILAGALAALLGARPGRRWLAATAAALAGLALLIAPGLVGPGGGRVDPLGVAAGLGAGAAYAVYTWCSRRLLDAGVPALPLLAALFAGGAVLIAPLGWQPALAWFTDPDGLLVVGYLAVAATAVPYLIWIHGMRTTAPAAATTLSLTEPLTATLLGLLLLGETLAPVAVAGAALIGLGLLLTVTARTERPTPPAHPVAPTAPAAPAGRTGRRPG